MTQYAGNDLFPTDFTIPDDSAPPTASNLLVSIEALGDRTIWLQNRGIGPQAPRMLKRVMSSIIASGDSAINSAVTINGHTANATAATYLNSTAYWTLASATITAPMITANPSNDFIFVAQVDGTVQVELDNTSEFGVVQLCSGLLSNTPTGTRFGGARKQLIASVGGGAIEIVPFTLRGSVTINTGTPDTFVLALDMRVSAASAGNFIRVLDGLNTTLETWVFNPT